MSTSGDREFEDELARRIAAVTPSQPAGLRTTRASDEKEPAERPQPDTEWSIHRVKERAEELLRRAAGRAEGRFAGEKGDGQQTWLLQCSLRGPNNERRHVSVSILPVDAVRFNVQVAAGDGPSPLELDAISTTRFSARQTFSIAASREGAVNAAATWIRVQLLDCVPLVRSAP
jgi:hypothetical protein